MYQDTYIEHYACAISPFQGRVKQEVTSCKAATCKRQEV
ncbi:hypothetical protein VCSRO210_2506 [Vibrio cholerae]|nr:hypothetical protein VCSRO162_0453 [Vibrio cholerae]GHX22778.1 hypothetical protein VCSRO107_1673 [Vibrio cholerae]GHX36731.1 hypothetical protein VCSRO62_2342 [Vibrio cholerae]GHX39298.1 hypothetical protein VCSRO205_1831 [Vibrio cholerae]GHX97650.1 hypothetical protein VCSRO210_2506 [Vibrio cholerae]